MANDIYTVIKSLEGFKAGKPATVEQVVDAELGIDVEFAEDYAKCLFRYGTITAAGLELFGISEHDDYDVVSNTLWAREKIPHMPDDVYVIERLGIDLIVAVQNTKGEVFTIAPSMPLVKHGDCLADHIRWTTEFNSEDWKKFNDGVNLPESTRRQMLKRERIEYWLARLEQLKSKE